MARKRTLISDGDAERVADTMFALAAPSRVQILCCLLSGAHSVAELVDAIGMEQSAVSHQLRLLREHELVRVERAGQKRVYTLFDDHVVRLLEEALRHVASRANRSSGLGQRLTRMTRRQAG
jgi:DNA-binding transcriptional ArsR family regulator